jgi:SAM-dependent methyltransferase
LPPAPPRWWWGGCQAPAFEVVPWLDLGATPLADVFPAEPDEHAERYPLRVGTCRRCWLVQLRDVVPDAVLYGSDYGFYSGASPALDDYRRRYADAVMAEHASLAERLTVEIGCNDGALLERLATAGATVLGVDPATTVVDVARARGLRAIGEPFGRTLAEQIVSTDGQAGLIVANNVLAHVADLADFVGGLAVLLADDGVAYLEVQYLPDLLLGNQFDLIYHEHRSYFSFRTLVTVLERQGLYANRVQRTPAQGGSIRVQVSHTSALSLDAEDLYISEGWLSQVSTYEAMRGRVGYAKTAITTWVNEQIRAGCEVAGIAASAKSTTLLNFCGLGPWQLSYIVDATPHKIGRYSPGTDIPIVGPDEREPPDSYLLLARNYLSHVLRSERKFLDLGGHIAVPLPQLTVI